MERRPIEKPDITERGGVKDGQPQVMERRLFMQLLAFGQSKDTGALVSVMHASGFGGTLYEDVNDPRGVALLTFSEDPAFFVGPLRKLLTNGPFGFLEPKPEYTMLGRSYSSGFEPDLEDWLIHKPRRTVLNKAWPWCVWYPLRRSGAFIGLPPEEQRGILMEHGTIGRSFGEADYAHDVRLACHGLDKNDNDFVIGLVGKELYPLSAIVQTMRKTTQTSKYLEKLGPFFVGRAVWQGEGK